MVTAEIVAIFRYLVLAGFIIVVLILASDGLSEEDMSVIAAMNDVSNKKNVT